MIKTFMKRITILTTAFLVSSAAFSSSEQTSLKNENVWKADITIFNTTGYSMTKTAESISGGGWGSRFPAVIEPSGKNKALAEPHWLAKELVMYVEWTLSAPLIGRVGQCTIFVKNEIKNSATSDIRCTMRPEFDIYPHKRIRNRIIGTNEFDFIMNHKA